MCNLLSRILVILLVFIPPVSSLAYASINPHTSTIKQQQGHYVSHMAIHHGPTNKPYKTALTFDDGPDLTYTPQILDMLKKMNIKATFFVIGKNAAKFPEIIKRIANEGHILANHSWDHANFVQLSRAQIRLEITKTDHLLTQITGHKPLLFRAPYGNVTRHLEVELRSMEHILIGWSVDTRDWAGPDVDTIIKTVTKQIKPGGIILQHCANGPKVDLNNTLQALPKIVSMLKQQGYEFVTVPELLTTQAYKIETDKVSLPSK